MLRPIVGGASVALSSERSTLIGRGFAGLIDEKLSRQHVRITRDVPGAFAVEALGCNGVAFCPVGGSVTVLKPGHITTVLRVCDEIGLLPDAHWFRLEDPKEEEPLNKRQRNSDAASSAGSSAHVSFASDA